MPGTALSGGPADGDLEPSALLRQVFGHQTFRPGQLEVIEDVFHGHPVVSIMPTGAGKSLCYQLPAVALHKSGGFTLVVSPLIALMKDQVDQLSARGVACAALTSAADGFEQDEILRRMSAGELALVFVAPERFRSGRFLRALAGAGSLSLLAIDEAHCISEWGHEFRPDYRRLGQVIGELHPERIIALTATATPEVRADIAAQLGIERPRMHVRGFARPSLRFRATMVRGVEEKRQVLGALFLEHRGLSGLVYCATRKNAEAYAETLGAQGHSVRVYHAGLGDAERTRAQDEFMAGEVDVVVATNAFGMGVDKADIRLVVHADVPRSAEAYYQEAGRGGRDGGGCLCVLLFDHAAKRLQEFLIEASNPRTDILRELWKLARDNGPLPHDTDAIRPALADRVGERLSGALVSSAVRLLERTGNLMASADGLHANRPAPGEYPALDPESLARRADVETQKLARMVEYAYSTNCRQRFLLEYFGEVSEDGPFSCGTCDACQGEVSGNELTEEEGQQVRQLLTLCSELSGRFGRKRLAGLANGSGSDERFADVPGVGCLSGHSLEYVMEILRALEGGGLLKRTRGDYPTLAIAKSGRQALDSGSLPSLVVREPASRGRARRASALATADYGEVDPERAEVLRQLRTRLAEAGSVPAYVVFNNKTLSAIAAIGPTSLSELAQVPGIGPSRLDRYGREILAALGHDG